MRVMGWELRKGHSYYYRKERGADARVRSIYFGRGERAKVAAHEDEERRERSVKAKDKSGVAQPPDVAQPPATEIAEIEREWAATMKRARNPSIVYRRSSNDSSGTPRRYRS
jgi:hypothetical protein